MGWLDDLFASAKQVDESVQALHDLNDRARATARHHRDQYDAAFVERLRELGRATGQQRHYERQIDRYLREQG
ncbi:hypothetical protein RB614_40560 [Phytohabitans sp. ZYX-F-186]|uniref:Uncharacterized protein n=1 Tax=Phytohabitans maris TaxID=3071409 RepID=A0ABU0ZUT2_9ACTN|nr:hypothetical protein [Phytohabitans sp. ZYX-F-186]MDQ7910803.1 hypothetical protein [Phytohabitans sp. ZYX-F-186]